MASLSFEPTFQKIETLAKKDGVEVELLIERGEKFQVSFQKGKTDKFDSSTSQVAGLRVIADGYEGYSYSENLSEEALVAAYREALLNAKFTAKGADPSLKVKLLAETGEGRGAGGEDAWLENPELFNDSIAHVAIEEKLERGRAIEALAYEKDARISAVPYNGYIESEGELQILTSTGIRRRQRSSGVAAYSYCLAKEGDESRMGGESLFTRNALEVAPKKVAEVAAERALAKLGAAPPETGHYPILIENEVVGELFGLIADYFSAKSVFQKTSLFGQDLGRTIASPLLTLIDDPLYPGGVATRAFDSEGAPVKKTPLISEGVLSNFLTNSVYAERMKLPHTASAARGARTELGISVSNLLVKPGTRSFEELRASKEKLIVITDFSGYHAGFNEGSGDFSLPAEGELWENGRRVRPLCNFVVSGNIRDLLQNIEALSSRLTEPKSSVIAPDMLVRELSVAGK
jgi:PmbA protein